VKKLAIFVTVILAFGTPAPAQTSERHLVYQFGYNTAVASSGQGTGTTTIDIKRVAADGGLIVSGQDYWWNTARPRATNTCEVYPTGTVSCAQRPYAISPIQLTLFPLLAHDFFRELNAAGTSSWTRNYSVKAAIIPGASNGFAGNPYTWKCSYHITGQGPVKGAAPLILILSNGTLDQQGGRYLNATSKQRIVYDPRAKVPAIVRDVRTHLPQRTVYNNDVVEVKLIKDSEFRH
jgi:hypothetical protein